MEKANETIKVNTVVLDTQHTHNYEWRWVIPVSTEKTKKSTNSIEVKQPLSKKVQSLWNVIGIVNENTSYEELINDGKEY